MLIGDFEAARGGDPFSELKSIVLVEGKSKYDEQRDQHALKIISPLVEATRRCTDALGEMNLPAALDVTDAVAGVPEALAQKAAIVAGAGGASRMAEKVTDLAELAASILRKITEAEAAIAAEEQDDAAMRSKHGNNWDRETSAELNSALKAEGQKYKTIAEKGMCPSTV